MWRVQLLIISYAFAVEEQNYRFYSAVGEVIYDYSGSYINAVNGSSHDDADKNMLQVSQRGIYSDGSSGD